MRHLYRGGGVSGGRTPPHGFKHNVPHGDAHDPCGNAGTDRGQYEGVVPPLMLHMFRLTAVRHGNADGILPFFQKGHTEGEARREQL